MKKLYINLRKYVLILLAKSLWGEKINYMKKKKLKVLGIDPGQSRSGAVLLNDYKIDKFFLEDNDKFLSRITAGEFSNIDTVGIEIIIPYGIVGKTIMETAEWIGMFRHAFEASGIKRDNILRLSRKSICSYWLNSRANDAKIRARMIEEFGKPGTKKKQGPTYGITYDVWSGLAVVGYTYYLTKETK